MSKYNNDFIFCYKIIQQGLAKNIEPNLKELDEYNNLSEKNKKIIRNICETTFNHNINWIS